MIDIVTEIKAIHRAVAVTGGVPVDPTTPVGDLVEVTLSRTYPADAADVWDALTQPDRIARWFMPISGELREGGTFQLEGNAGGDILSCRPPEALTVTFGGPESLVHLSLAQQGADTVVELRHTVPIAMAGSTAGALFVGPGWDGAFLALGLYLRGESAADPVAAAGSPEAQQFCWESVHAWREVVIVAGGVSLDEITGGVEMALAQYAPDLAAAPE